MKSKANKRKKVTKNRKKKKRKNKKKKEDKKRKKKEKRKSYISVILHCYCFRRNDDHNSFFWLVDRMAIYQEEFIQLR